MDEQDRARREEWLEAELLAEEATGKIIKRPALQGVADMQVRIDYLERLIKTMLDRAEQKVTTTEEATVTAHASLTAELREARERLAQYQTQHEGRN